MVMSNVIASPSAEHAVVLRDGATVAVRPVVPHDAPAIQSFLERLSPDSLMFRFFSLGVNLHQAAEMAAHVDDVDAFGVIATGARDGRVVGHACYVRTSADEAEIAFATADELQGHGLATILLACLAEAATRNGIHHFVAHVLPANHRMIQVFRDSGFAVEVGAAPGELLVELSTHLTLEAQGAYEQRARVAARAATMTRPQNGPSALRQITADAMRSRGDDRLDPK
jgi:RimJ/RimL family protein N-acetyltransferase